MRRSKGGTGGGGGSFVIPCVLFVVVSLMLTIFKVGTHVAELETPHSNGNPLEKRRSGALVNTSIATAHEDAVGEEPLWHPRLCFKGTTLHHPKIVKSCRDGEKSGAVVDPQYCQQILNQSSSTSPVCGQYATGVFEPRFTVFSEDDWSASAHLSREMCDDASTLFRADLPDENTGLTFVDATVEQELQFGERKLLQPTRQCKSFSYFSRRELVSVLHRASMGRNKRGMLFTGDSITRQLMLRIVSFVRGEKFFSEHYFHQDGLYLLFEHSDALVVLDAAGKQETAYELEQYFPGYLTPTEVEALKKRDAGKLVKRSLPILALMFQWETKPSVYRREFLRMPQVPVHVAAFMYWWQNKDATSDINEYMSASEKLFRSEDSAWKVAGSTKDYIFMTTPWTDPGLFGGVEPKTRVERNGKVVDWIRKMQLASVGESTRWSLLDYSAIAEAEHLPKTKDGIHYMCIWTPKYPDTVKMQKFNYNECRDPMGLAVVQWLGHIIATGLVS